jgi:hypothetical protein
MNRRFLLLLPVFLVLAAATRSFGAPPAPVIEKANVLPLALDDAFEFRKTKIFLNDPEAWKPTLDPMINFERQRANFGAVNQYDRQQRRGQYYTFFWKARRAADLTFRFEYRQEKLGAFVQAQERSYRNVKGSVKSEFAVIGDDYTEEGRVTAWRAVLIENGKIVALNQSFLWR